MATLYTKVKLYLEANSKTFEAENDNIVLRKMVQVIIFTLGVSVD